MAKVTSFELISHDTVFFSHNKTASAGLSAAKTISRTAYEVGAPILCYSIHAKNYKGTHTTRVDRNGVSHVAPVRPPVCRIMHVLVWRVSTSNLSSVRVVVQCKDKEDHDYETRCHDDGTVYICH